MTPEDIARLKGRPASLLTAVAKALRLAELQETSTFVSAGDREARAAAIAIGRLAADVEKLHQLLCLGTNRWLIEVLPRR